MWAGLFLCTGSMVLQWASVASSTGSRCAGAEQSNASTRRSSRDTTSPVAVGAYVTVSPMAISMHVRMAGAGSLTTRVASGIWKNNVRTLRVVSGARIPPARTNY